jgi:predicted PurR-regulated permease PerM
MVAGMIGDSPSVLTPPRAHGSTPQHAAFGVLAGALVLLGVFTLWHFLSALVWAGIFAIALWPLYRRAIGYAGARAGSALHGTLLPALFTAAVALIFIGPLAAIGIQLAREFHALSEFLHKAQQNGLPAPDFLHHLPFGQAAAEAWWQQNLSDPGQARGLVERFSRGHVADFGRNLGEQVARRITLFIFTLLTLFFLFKEGHDLTQQMRRAAARAFGPGGERVGMQIIASVHGTVTGLVLVGLGEGLLLGVIYALAGVPHPTVLGAFTAVAAMIPFAPGLAIGVAALLLVAKGSMVAAGIVAAAGIAVTFTADHFIRPTLIGGATRLPFIWVLLGILGGVEMWGLIGLFLGPAIMAALILLWREWTGQETK